jgi:hypothetical protein
MNQELINQISEEKFNAYFHKGSSARDFLCQELEWYEAYEFKVLAVILIDFDNEYAYILLGRDEKKQFRCFDLKSCFKSLEETRLSLFDELSKLKNNSDTFEQGEKPVINDIFKIIVKDENLHPHFKSLVSSTLYEPARNLIQELAYNYCDLDGNFIQQFQSLNGFNARLWELYLFAYFNHNNFHLSSEFSIPDFIIDFGDNTCLIEATTVNEGKLDEKPPENKEELKKYLNNYLPIKYGGPLTKKLKKYDEDYSKLEHVKGKPFVIALHDYHYQPQWQDIGAASRSSVSLEQYLYGLEVTQESIRKGKIESRKDFQVIHKHEWKHKSIPSNFFNLPGAENISAILFSNAGTVPKFHRMGRLANLGSNENIAIYREGYRYNPDSIDGKPLHFMQDVTSKEYNESWNESMTMFHNPRAKYPVDPSWFNNINHIYYDYQNDIFSEYIVPYNVINSITVVLSLE